LIKLPSDRIILQAIYDKYHESFLNFEANMADRESKIMVPIDCEAIADQLRVHPEIVFGRLYYHLQREHGYKRDEGEPRVAFFVIEAGSRRHCVNLPLLASVLAGLQEDHEWKL
jgi:hypothetical protein